MNNKIENLKNLTYEEICFIFNREPNKNKLLRKIEAFKFRNFDLIREKYQIIKTDYLIISSNPIFSNIIGKKLEDYNIRKVFINNYYSEDNFNYSVVDKKFLENILKNLSINPKYDGINYLKDFFTESNCKKYCYTTNKNTALSTMGKKINDYYCFSYINQSKEANKEYENIWNNYVESMEQAKNKWDNPICEQKNNFFYVFTKNIICLVEKNEYVAKELFLNKKNIFVFDYNKHNGELFEKEFEDFININKNYDNKIKR